MVTWRLIYKGHDCRLMTQQVHKPVNGLHEVNVISIWDVFKNKVWETDFCHRATSRLLEHIFPIYANKHVVCHMFIGDHTLKQCECSITSFGSVGLNKHTADLLLCIVCVCVCGLARMLKWHRVQFIPCALMSNKPALVLCPVLICHIWIHHLMSFHDVKVFL